jgi:hypothetical protein
MAPAWIMPLALYSRLAANGIHGQLIFYRWHVRNTIIEGSHVMAGQRADAIRGSGRFRYVRGSLLVNAKNLEN